MAEDKGAKVERQLVVFDLAGELYGVDIARVREIIRMQEITYVPNAPNFVEGVTNLRGKITPVINIRKRFGLGGEEGTKDTRIVVVDIDGEDMGIQVDSVKEVLRINEQVIVQPSSVVTTVDSYYMEGIANLGDRLIILLDLNKVLSDGETSSEGEQVA
jgi:purine-binding chemotaxis protein CheW